MPSRHLLAGALMVVALLTATTACGNDSDVAKSTSTTAKPAASSTTAGDSAGSSAPDTTTGEDTTETTVARTAFADSIGRLNSDLDAAKGDACKLFALFDSTATVEDPSDKAESEQAIAYVVRLLNAVADAAPASLSTEADAIRATAKKVQDQAAAAGYDPAFLSSEKFTAFDDPAFNTAMQKFSEQISSECAPTTGG